MVLVLILVPALVAILHDIGRQIRALRRALRHPRTAPVLRLAAGAVGLWLVLTLGWVVWQGVLPGPLAGVLPGLAGAAPVMAALLLFLAGVAVVLLAGYGAVLLRGARGRGVA